MAEGNTVSTPSLKSSEEPLNVQIPQSNNGKPKQKQPQPDDKTKDLVSKLMAQESYRLEFLEKQFDKTKKHSVVWNKFKEAVVDGNRVGIFKCNSCQSLFIYKSSTGNSAMNRHDCENTGSKKTKTKANSSMTAFTRKIVPQESLRELNRNITIGLAVDLQPLGRVEGRGFLHIAQSLVNFGARFGAQPVSDIIQHRTTLQRNRLPDICGDIFNEVKSELQTISTMPHLALTSDMWTEILKSQSFLSLSIHFLDNEWILRKKMLGLEPYDGRKTTVNIRKDCEKILLKYFDESCIDEVMVKSYAVTDGDSGISAVFPNRQPCQCHKINLCCEWTFSDKTPIAPEKIKKRASKGNPYHPKVLFNLTRDCPSIASTIKGVKELVTHFRKSHLNSKLSTTLKQEVCTRFNSLLFLLESYKNVMTEVKSILVETDRLSLLININDDIVRHLVDYLEPFDDALKVLSGDGYPTINLVALQYHKLSQHIQVNDGDSNEMKTLKQQAVHCFEEYCQTTEFHLMACMLDPRYVLHQMFSIPPNLLCYETQEKLSSE